MNNPVNMIDPNGYLADFIWENHEINNNPKVDAITSAAPVIPKTVDLNDTANTIIDKAIKDKLKKAPRQMSMNQAVKSLPNRNAIRVYIRGLAPEVLNVKLPVPGSKLLSAMQKTGVISPILFIPTSINDFRNNKGRKAWIALGIDSVAMVTGIAISFPGGIPGALAQTYITNYVTKNLKEWANVE